jgi:hypothetical protein
MKNGNDAMDTLAEIKESYAETNRDRGLCEYIEEDYNPDFVLVPCQYEPVVKHGGKWYCEDHYERVLAQEAEEAADDYY